MVCSIEIFNRIKTKKLTFEKNVNNLIYFGCFEKDL